MKVDTSGLSASILYPLGLEALLGGVAMGITNSNCSFK